MVKETEFAFSSPSQKVRLLVFFHQLIWLVQFNQFTSLQKFVRQWEINLISATTKPDSRPPGQEHFHHQLTSCCRKRNPMEYYALCHILRLLAWIGKIGFIPHKKPLRNISKKYKSLPKILIFLRIHIHVHSVIFFITYNNLFTTL